MPALQQFMSARQNGANEIVALTPPLRETTPSLLLAEPFAKTVPFGLETINRYDGRGPAQCWGNAHTDKHTSNHFDAPYHWLTARDLPGISQLFEDNFVGRISPIKAGEFENAPGEQLRLHFAPESCRGACHSDRHHHCTTADREQVWQSDPRSGTH